MSALKKEVLLSTEPSHNTDAGLSHSASLKELHFENQRLSRQLKSFIAKARQNEEKLHRFQELELRLIECGSLFELLQLVLYEYRATSKLDQVTLKLYDPEYELRRILEADCISLGDHPSLIFTEAADELEQLFRYNYAPVLGPYRQAAHGSLFLNRSQPPRSVALLPIVRNGEMIGCLHLGSHREERFTPGSGTDFLQRLATIVGACLNNVTTAERLKQVGLTDVLTGVNNRRFFDQRLREEVNVAHRKHHSLCALFFDVDHFKQINDVHGHQAGDLVLREVAGIIRNQLRTSDVLARYGGEEFSALLMDTPLEKAMEIAERIRRAIATTNYTINKQQCLNVTISIGVSSLQCHDQPFDATEVGHRLLQQADECLYEAKHAGRNQVICHQLPEAACLTE